MNTDRVGLSREELIERIDTLRKKVADARDRWFERPDGSPSEFSAAEFFDAFAAVGFLTDYAIMLQNENKSLRERVNFFHNALAWVIKKDRESGK